VLPTTRNIATKKPDYRYQPELSAILPGVEVLSRHEYGITTLGVDPHREMVVIYLLDEGEQARTRLASADCHGEPP
jgi:hypothetical protein